MGKRILQRRKGRACSMLNNSVRTHKIQPSCLPHNSYAQRNGYLKVTVSKLRHESGRSAPLATGTYDDQVHAGKKQAHFVAVEGMHTGQSIVMGKKAPLAIANVLYLKNIPEGAIISNIELNRGDGGVICRAAGTFATVFSQSPEINRTTIKLPSGHKKLMDNNCRAMIGQIASAGIVEPPLLKASNSYFKRKAKGKKSVRVSGMAKNPVEHPHGGGNHQHIGKPTCVARILAPGKKAQGHVAARQTGRNNGRKKVQIAKKSSAK